MKTSLLSEIDAPPQGRAKLASNQLPEHRENVSQSFVRNDAYGSY
jgi:hypothetical protein